MKFKVNAFEIVYLAISIATFNHTVWSAAFVFEGNPPEFITGTGVNVFNDLIANYSYYGWFLSGALVAIAIDAGMLISARALAKRWDWILGTAFAVGALASFFTQLLYSLHHTRQFNLGEGVSSYWNTALNPVVEARVVIIPLMLPIFALVYTAALITQKRAEIKEEMEMGAEPLEFVYGGKLYGPFESKEQMLSFQKKLVKKLGAGNSSVMKVLNKALAPKPLDWEDIKSGTSALALEAANLTPEAPKEVSNTVNATYPASTNGNGHSVPNSIIEHISLEAPARSVAKVKKTNKTTKGQGKTPPGMDAKEAKNWRAKQRRLAKMAQEQGVAVADVTEETE